jgi:hypothetical protein
VVVVEAPAVLVSVDMPPDGDPWPSPGDPSCRLEPVVATPPIRTWLGEFFGRSGPLA